MRIYAKYRPVLSKKMRLASTLSIVGALGMIVTPLAVAIVGDVNLLAPVAATSVTLGMTYIGESMKRDLSEEQKPVARKRFTRTENGTGSVSIESDDIQEIILYLYEVENYFGVEE